MICFEGLIQGASRVQSQYTIIALTPFSPTYKSKLLSACFLHFLQ